MKVNRHEIHCEKDLKRTLDTMFQLSKEDCEPFYGLTDVMKSSEIIITAIHNIKANRGSKTAGVDKKDINAYLQMDKEKLFQLIRRHIDNYNPMPVRRVYIAKANGKLRPLGIPTIIDRIIQEIARIILDPIAEGKFFKHSYGFRPYRACEHAVARVVDLINRGRIHYVIEGDIKSFFDNINHNKLISILWNMGIKDTRFLMIIKKMLKAGIMEQGKISESELGTPQGGIISPLLANIYLNNFDWMISSEFETHPARFQAKDPRKKGLERVRQRHDACYLVRYADDWVILCEDEDMATKILKLADKYFRHKLKLELSLEKTLITNIRDKPIKFLGFDIRAQKGRVKDRIFGKAAPNKDKIVNKVRGIKKELTKLRDLKSEHEKAAHLEIVNSKIVGLSNYYKIGNCSSLFSKLDYSINNGAYKVFTKIYGRRNWKSLTSPAGELHNRPDRHQGHRTRVYHINVDNVRVGLTRLSFTKSCRAMNFNQNLSPYTEYGRKLYSDKVGKKFRLYRPTLYHPEDLKSMSLHLIHPDRKRNRLYNFEFFMNREYAFNRDKGVCKICKVSLNSVNYHCHHVKPRLPMDEVNKVANLLSVCSNCHVLIHGTSSVDDSMIGNKIIGLRNKLAMEPT